MDPRRGSNDGNYDSFPVLQSYADRGCKGFGEILANLPTNDPRMKGIYEACGKLGFCVLFDPNLYADLSAGSALNALSRDRAVAKAFLEKHYRKLFFGTDRFVREEDPLMIDLVRTMALPGHMETAIFAGNAQRMLACFIFPDIQGCCQ